MSWKKILGNKFILILIAITIIPVLYYITTSYSEEILSVKLLSVADTSYEVLDTTCYFKTSGIAQKGSLQNTKQSQMIIRHPVAFWGQLSLVDIEGVKDPIDTFSLTVKGRCDSKNIWVVESSQLTFEVLSQNKKLEKITTYKTIKSTSEKTLANNHEESLITLSIKASDIENNLPDNEYNLYHEFQVSGKLTMYYKSYPTQKYKINIPADSIRVYYNTIKTSNSENVPQPYTGCPTGKTLVENTCKIICPEGKILVDNQCTIVTKTPDIPEVPLECPTGYKVMNNKCVQSSTEDDKPPVTPNAYLDLLKGLIDCIILNGLNCTGEPKYSWIFYSIGLLVFLYIIYKIATIGKKPKP